MKHFIFLLSFILLFTVTTFSQINVGSNTAPDSSAMLQISGNTKGFLPPRMSRDSMYLIAKPAKGLLVFNTTDSLLFMRRDSGWIALAAGDQLWQKNGNNIYNQNSGFVGIGTTTPSTLLHVTGANPLTLLGVADGTTDVTDSVLTITNGLVRKIPLSSLAMVSNGISSANLPLVYSGGMISINQASTTDDGYLSASDYNIFNNKVSSIALTASPLYPTTSFAISSNGAASASLSLSPQVKNKVFAGPATGGNVQPTFRALTGADLPVATTTATTGLGVISVGNGLSVTPGGVLSVTNPSSGGSVTSASVVTANGLAGTVANPTTTPAITLTTTVTGMVKGNGTSLLPATSGTDYAPGTSANTTGIVKSTTGTGALTTATSGTDYAPGTAANTTGIVKSTTGTGALTTATASDFPTLNQNTTGTASNITGVLNANSHPALTGDVTTPSGSVATTISNSAVTNAKMANMAANTFKANNTGSAAAPADINGTQATAMLDVFSSTTKGLTPASGGGTANFLRADGTFAVPPGTNTNAGTVTSVSVTTANGVSGTVATNTTTPAISLTLGAITPSSVAATGTVTGSNLSGTNTGDETNATIKTKLGTATTTNDGYLTSTDWNTFNNKQSSITNLGDTAKYLKKVDSSIYTSSYQNSLKQNLVTLTTTGTGAATFNQSSGALNIPTSATYYNTNTGSGNRLAIPNTNQIKTVFATAPLTADSTTNTNALTFGITQAGTSSNGYLSSADWNTFNNKATSFNTWSIIGNTGTNAATNFLGTADNKSLRFRTNNLQRMIMDSLGNVGIGSDVFDVTNPEKFMINAGNTTSVNGLVAKGTINNYFQMNIKNLSSGANATSDIVATADNGTESTNYVDLGINGSGYTGSAIQTGIANDGYLISSGNDFYMVNSSANKNMLFLTGGTGVANERMRILANGRVGMGVQDPTAQFVVKDTMEIRRTGSLSQLLFTNTAGTGDFRIGGDGGDFYWQGGGSRNLQMGSYWATVLGGDRQGQGGTYPSFAGGTGGTGVLVQGQRDASIPFAVQANSASQSANLTEWRNSAGTALNVINNIGNLGLGTTNPSYKLQVSSAADPLSLLGVQTGANTDSIVTILNGVVRKLSPSALSISSSNAWGLTGNTNTLSNNYFLGTTNTDPLIFKVNSQQAGRIDGVNTFLGTLAGNSNGTTANQNTGVGYHALYTNTSGTYNTALGYGSLQNNGTGSNNIGIGNNAGVANNSSNSIAMGTNSVVNYSNSIAVGTGAQANNTGAVGIGNNTYVNGLYGIAIGSGPNSPITQAFGNYSVALGYNSYGGTTNSIAIGTSSISNGSNGTALGNAASSASANSTAIGTSASVTGANSTAIGYNAVAATDNALVLGDKNNTGVSVAIGSENFSNGNREKLLVDAGTTNSVNVISGKGTINSYLQLNIQNKSTGTAASSDVVATADNGDETTNYIDMGINSSTNSANYFGGANDAYLYTLGQNMLIGTAAASKSISFLTGGGTQSTNERMRIDGTGKVGIGNIAPTEKLDITGNLKFSGAIMPNNVPGTAGQVLTSSGSNSAPVWATFSANAPLSLNSGVVAITQANSTTNGYLSSADWNTFNNKASNTNSWSTTGNAGTTSGSNFFGTTDNTSLKFRTNNTQMMLLDSLGNTAIGSAPAQTSGANIEKFLVDAGTTNSFNVISGKGNINNYLQLNIQNRNAGGNASSDVVATADNGDESNNFVDLGINSSVNNTNYFGAANDAYLYAQSQNMLVGTASANKSVVFLTGGGTQSSNERMRIDGSGNVGIGTNAPATKLQIVGTNPLTLNGVQVGTNTSNDSLLTITSGLVRKLPLSTFSTTTAWSTTGNAGTTAGTNFIGTTDAQDFVLKANNTERFRIINGTSSETGTTGDIKIGDATSGTFRSTKEMVMREDGDQFGPSTLRLRNRNGENGAIFETIGATGGAYLVDFIFRTGASVATQITSNQRFETRASNIRVTGNTTEWQFGQPDNATLVVSAASTGNSSFRIGNLGIGITAPTASLHLRAGTATAGTAPLKLTSGTNMSTPEAGAVEYDGTNYFATSGSTRYTLAKTLTNTGSLAFNSTAANTSSNATTNITVTGAVSGDVVILGIPSTNGAAAGSYSAYVSANDTVTVKFTNNTTGAITPATGTFRVSILKY